MNENGDAHAGETLWVVLRLHTHVLLDEIRVPMEGPGFLPVYRSREEALEAAGGRRDLVQPLELENAE